MQSYRLVSGNTQIHTSKKKSCQSQGPSLSVCLCFTGASSLPLDPWQQGEPRGVDEALHKIVTLCSHRDKHVCDLIRPGKRLIGEQQAIRANSLQVHQDLRAELETDTGNGSLTGNQLRIQSSTVCTLRSFHFAQMKIVQITMDMQTQVYGFVGITLECWFL